MCTIGEDCSSYAPGHAMHLIQARLVSATPSEWTDALVTAVDADAGVVNLQRFDDGARLEIWTAAPLDLVVPGSPVAVHVRYHALAVGRQRLNIAVL